MTTVCSNATVADVLGRNLNNRHVMRVFNCPISQLEVGPAICPMKLHIRVDLQMLWLLLPGLWLLLQVESVCCL